MTEHQEAIRDPHAAPRRALREPFSRRSRALLQCGVIAGPLFFTTVTAQVLTRNGFDPTQHYLSLLSLGDLGWIQATNFITAGLLVTASAVGMRRALIGRRAGTWGPRLFAAYGMALIWAGIFPTDPADGFPPGVISSTPAGPTGSTWHGLLHTAGPAVMGIALYAACLVFARRFASLGQRRWALYCLGTVAADLGTGILAASIQDSRWLLVGGALTWGWASIIAARLIAEGPT